MTPREIVKQFVSRWSDEKLAQVFAFNEDGKMDYCETCCCLIGVDTSQELHVIACGDEHYSRARGGSLEAETAYRDLGYECWSDYDTAAFCWDAQGTRNRIFCEILTKVMTEREAARHPVDTEQLAESLSCNPRFLADMGLSK